LGKVSLGVVAECGDFAAFSARSLVAAVGAPRLGRRFVRSIYEQGVQCMPVVLIVGAFTGLVLGLQIYYVLNRFGSAGALGTIISLTLVRELAPV
jgi:phospholipid/cholesterol/gamma-HCH transport system permease protein